VFHGVGEVELCTDCLRAGGVCGAQLAHVATAPQQNMGFEAGTTLRDR
jgi:hypothetical protein